MRLATVLLAVPLALMMAGTARAEDTLYTAEGYAIGMTVSPAYGTAPALEQDAMTTLNGLLHGPELATLHVTIETPQEVARDCGSADALACHGEDQMIIPGEQVADGPPVPFLVAHEYAHHILAHRVVAMTDPKMGTVVDVPCPVGMTAISGGAETPHTLNSYLNDSHPTNGRSWEVSLVNAGDVPEQLTAWVVCAKVENGRPQAAIAKGATIRRFELPR